MVLTHTHDDTGQICVVLTNTQRAGESKQAAMSLLESCYALGVDVDQHRSDQKAVSVIVAKAAFQLLYTHNL